LSTRLSNLRDLKFNKENIFNSLRSAESFANILSVFIRNLFDVTAYHLIFI
jgi:hypothetical protein